MFSIARTMYSACAFLTPAVRWETVADSPNPLAVKDKSILQLRVGLLALGIISSVAAASAWVGMPIRFASVVLFASSVAVWKLLPVIFKFESQRAKVAINTSKNEYAIHLFKTTSLVNNDVMTTLMNSPSALEKLVEETEDAPKLKLLFDATVNRPDTPSFHLLKPLVKKLNQNRRFMADNFDSLLKACMGKHNNLFVDILKENPIDGSQISEEVQFRAMAHDQMDDSLLTCLLGMGFSTKEKLAIHLFKTTDLISDQVKNTLMSSPSALTQLVEDVEDENKLKILFERFLNEWRMLEPDVWNVLKPLIKKLNHNAQFITENWMKITLKLVGTNNRDLLVDILKENAINGTLVPEEEQFNLLANCWMDDALLGRFLEMGFNINAKNGQGRTPLTHWLMWRGSLSIIERLLKFGATIPNLHTTMNLHTTITFLPTQGKSTSLHKHLSEYRHGQEILSVLAKTEKERNTRAE